MALKIIFMGTPEFAVPILDSINKSKHNILSVYTQPPKKRDRGLKLRLSSIHEYSKATKLAVRHPDNLNSDEEIKKITELNPDVVVVAAYGKILPLKLLKIKNLRFINVHASLLPKWRGAAPIQRAIMNLDKETGISIMKIESKLDSGPVMMQSKIRIPEGTNSNILSSIMSKLGSEMIIKSLDLIEEKKEEFIPQEEKDATYAKKISKIETKINWNETAKKIVAKINALYPNPGTWFEIDGLRIKPIKVREVKINGKPGSIINKDFTIACSENSVQILELQKEGKQPMKIEEFLKGNKLKIGTNLISDV